MESCQAARQSSPASGPGLPPTVSRASSASGQVPETATQGQSYQAKLAGRANSGVANALAAAAAGGVDRDVQAVTPSGRLLSNNVELQYDIAVRLPGESQTQLEVNPITIVASDPFFEMRQRIAVNEHFICYSLKTCQIRALHKSTGRRALIKGAIAPPDIRFASNTVSRLASADLGRRVTIWDITMEQERADNKLTETLVVCFAFTDPDGLDVVGRPPFVWHPTSTTAQILAIGDGMRIYVIDVPAAAAAAEESQIECHASATQLPTAVRCIQCPELVTALAFSTDGGKLAAATARNEVFVWPLPNNGSSLSDYESLELSVSFKYETDSCSTILWVSATVLVTGNADNSTISLWHVTDTVELLQALTFTNTAAPSDSSFFNHMDVQPDTQLLILANSRQNAVYTLHFTGRDDALRFDYLADFSVSQPIMSFTVHYNPSDNPAALHLYCIQPTAIQSYTLNPALCCPSGCSGPTTTPANEPSGTMVSQHLPSPSSPMSYARRVMLSLMEATSAPPPTTLPGPQMAAPASQQQPPSIHAIQQPASPADPTKQSPAVTPAERLLMPQDEAPSAPATRLPAEHQMALPSSQPQPPYIRTTAQPASPAGPTEQPRLLTPTHLMQQGKRSGSQSSVASLLSQHTPTSAARSVADNTDAVSTASTQGSKLQEGSVSRQQSAETIPSSAAALDASISAHPDSPIASVSESRATTPPPSTPALPSAAYLTPEQYNPHRQSPEALPSTGSQRDLRLDLVSKPGSSDQVNVKVLRRDDRGPGSSWGQPSAGPSAVFSQPLDLLPVANAAQPPQSPLPEAAPVVNGGHGEEGPAGASLDSSAELLGRSAELSSAAVKTVADAVAERTLAQHKQLLSYLNERHREMLRIIKADIREEGKRLQLVFDAQVSTMVKSQAGMVGEERRVLLAEQNASLERLVKNISATINRDLPLRMEEIIRAEVASITTDVQQQVGGAVQAALSQTLPQELAGPHLKAALQASLGSQLQHALARPLQDSFTASFQQHLMPAFEGACRDMFTQVQATFAGGLQEHLQAAGGANAATAASLRESLGASAQILNQLKSQKGGFLSLADLEAQHDPTLELSHLIRNQRYEEAFHKVLGLEDVGMVSWLCQQLEPEFVLSQNPSRLSQQLLLPLIQQLGSDLQKDTSSKLKWIQSTALALDPQEPSLAPHMKPTLEQLYTNLQQVLSQSSNREAANQARMCQHLINSLIHSCIT